MELPTERSLPNSRRFRFYQFLAFVITASLYTTFHAARTAWAYSHKFIENDPYFTDQILSILDTFFMLSYAAGLFYNGWLGDQSNLKTFLVKGGLLSVISLHSFAVLAQIKFHNLLVFCLLFCIFGYGQSKGFPGSMAVLGNWIGTASRGLVIGLWSINVNLGNIIGQQIGKIMIDINHYEWFTTIFAIAALMLFVTVLTFFFLKVHPKDAGFIPNPEEVSGTAQLNDAPETPEIKTDKVDVVTETQPSPALKTDETSIAKGIGFREAWATPGLVKYALTYACIKGATYGMLFWLPNYLHTIIGFGGESANISTAYEFGQLVGGVLLGHLSDRLKKRSLVLVGGLYISALIFMITAMLGSGTSAWIFAILLLFAGIFFGGPETIVGGVVSSDLGSQECFKNNSKAISTMTGIIDGCGSIGAAIVQLIIPYVKRHSFLLFFTLCTGAAALSTHQARLEAKSASNEDNQKLMKSQTVELKSNL